MTCAEWYTNVDRRLRGLGRTYVGRLGALKMPPRAARLSRRRNSDAALGRACSGTLTIDGPPLQWCIF
eukprot:961335-Prorocentrum_minimum.AAC.1